MDVTCSRRGLSVLDFATWQSPIVREVAAPRPPRICIYEFSPSDQSDNMGYVFSLYRKDMDRVYHDQPDCILMALLRAFEMIMRHS
jgi:hypothetical protein